MSERIKNMTVQQLIDAGFKVFLSKHYCGDNPLLDAKQWLNNPAVHSSGGSSWATNWVAYDDINPELTFYK